MYCGDETGSFVGEVASHSCRFGYGGDDSPKASFQSFMYQDGTVPITTSRIPPQVSTKDIVNADSSPNSNNFEDVLAIYNSHYDSNIYSVGSTPTSSNAMNDMTFPGLDPNFHMKNDGIIHNFDAWENVWHKAFDQLNVRHLGKHTSGTVQAPRSRKDRKRARDDNTSSETITKSNDNDESTDAKLMHPILAVDSGYTYLTSTTDNATSVGTKFKNAVMQKQRTTMMEIILESLSAPAMFLAPTPMLASFAHGRQTSLLVDVGASGTRVTPVVDGLLLENSQRRNGRGGEWLNCVQHRALMEVFKEENKTLHVHPRYALKYKFTEGRKGVVVGYPPHKDIQNSIFHQLAMRDVMYEMKTSSHMMGISIHRDEDWSVPFVDRENCAETNISDETEEMDVDGEGGTSQVEEDDDNKSKTEKCYELPDGTQIDLSKTQLRKDLRRLPELLFASETSFFSSTNTLSTHQSYAEKTLSSLPMHELIKSSLTAVADADVRKELCGNIILTGATSLFPNMEQRLSLELSDIIPSMHKCKVLASRNTMERRYSAWIGGSVLTSLGSFQQLWLSHKEYEENGAILASQRFP